MTHIHGDFKIQPAKTAPTQPAYPPNPPETPVDPVGEAGGAPVDEARDPWEPTDTEAAAERAVLGAMMWPHTAYGLDGTERMANPAIPDVLRVLRPEHLYQPRHQMIMRAIIAMHDDGVHGIDPLMVGDELTRRGEFTRVGAAPYLHTLLQECATLANVDYYAAVVRAAADRRAAIEFGMRVQQLAATTDPDTLATQISAEHAAYLNRVSQADSADLVPVAHDDALVDHIVATWGETSTDVMTTGLADVDAVLNVGRGGLVTIAARSGVGKSIAAAQLARHFALERGEVAVVFSAEMTKREMYERDLSALAKVRLDSATGRTDLDARSMAKLVEAAEVYKSTGVGLIYDDTPVINTRHIRSRLMQVQQMFGRVDLFVIDYLGICDLPPADREDQRIGEFTRANKITAKEFGCFGVQLAQLNRGPESRADGVPKTSDMRGSDRIEHDSDAVILIHDPARYDETRLGEIDWILGKQRKGVSHVTVGLADLRHTAQFGGLAPEDGGEKWWQR